MTLEAEFLPGYWIAYGLKEKPNGRLTAEVLHLEFPDSTGSELLAASRANGVNPTALELEGWEQFWIELGLDSEQEAEQTEATGWVQPPLPGFEEM